MSARTPSSSSCSRPLAKSVRMKRVSHATSCGEVGEALLGDRVAVERDQRPGGAEALGEQARVAAAAERAVDDDVARARVRELEDLVRQDGDVLGGHVKKADQVAR